jgi:hypothetical protein
MSRRMRRADHKRAAMASDHATAPEMVVTSSSLPSTTSGGRTRSSARMPVVSRACWPESIRR